ncbi:MAG: gas vesicle protein GvpG [bacterium]|nr:gas vesicle protein GvpG [bacterium]MDZ4346296.1 gas vesicle protein GvpG [Candidatus Binatia bacterium]
MAFLFDDLIFWIGQEIKEMAEAELYGNKEKINERLLDLQARLDMGEIQEKEYIMREKELLNGLEEIRAREDREG